MAAFRRGLATEGRIDAVQQGAHMIDTMKAFDVCETSIPNTGRKRRIRQQTHDRAR
jgi:hypothetical protein